jgi:hypothetical protein
MKKLLFVLMIGLFSCSPYETHKTYLDEVNTIVLKKQEFHMWYSTLYSMYVYDGNEAVWCDCSKKIYDKYKEGSCNSS